MGFWGQNSIRGQALFQPLVEEGLFPERVPMFNVENACATASTAFMGAWKDVLAGTHQLSFCIGIEKLFSPEVPERTSNLFNQGYITSQHDRLVEEMDRVCKMVGSEFKPGDDRTIFMRELPKPIVGAINGVAAGGGANFEPTISPTRFISSTSLSCWLVM